jgi:hypothetical protein
MNEAELLATADELLKKAGFSSIEDPACPMVAFCNKHLDTTKCNEDYCILLKNIRNNTLSKNAWVELANQIEIIPNQIEGTQLTCPRSIQSHAKITKFCTNTECHFNSEKMAFHCLLLHGRAFFPNDDIPARVKEVCTSLTSDKLNYYVNISVQLMRIYLILFKYGIENLKMDYTLEKFQTKHIYKLLNNEAIIECCPKCGAIVKKREKQKIQIKNSDEYYFQDVCNCDCSDVTVYEKRMQVLASWKKMLSSTEFDDKLLTARYDEFDNLVGNNFSRINFMRYLLSNFNFDGLYLKQIPIGYMLRAYKLLFGKFDPSNFGLSKKIGNLMINLFDPAQGE